MALREVRHRQKLVFKFDPDLDLIEVIVNGQREVINLDDYRPLHRRRYLAAGGVNFDRIEGIDESAQMCYSVT